jgi:hypothetical protein
MGQVNAGILREVIVPLLADLCVLVSDNLREARVPLARAVLCDSISDQLREALVPPFKAELCDRNSDKQREAFVSLFVGRFLSQKFKILVVMACKYFGMKLHHPLI